MITPIQKQWEYLKFLINDFELIDIYRAEKIAKARYEKSIINYDY